MQPALEDQDDAATIISTFNKKAYKKGGEDKQKTDWGERRKELGKFHTKLKSASEVAQKRWQEIQALKGRGTTKNAKKAEFMKMLERDPECKEKYWSEELEKTHIENKKTSSWRVDASGQS